MVAKQGPIKLTMNAGELDPDVHERIDVKTRPAGLSKMRNLEPVPQGGCRLMPGTVRHGCTRNLMEVVPGVGTNEAVTQVHTVGSFMLFVEVDPDAQASALTLENWAVDVVDTDPGFQTVLSESTGTIKAQIETNGVWSDFGANLPLTETPSTYTIALPPGETVGVDAIRIISIPTGPTKLASGATVSLLRETDTRATPRLETLSREKGETYLLAMIPGFGDVYKMDGGTRLVSHVGAFTHPMTAAQLADQHTFARGETVGFFSENMRTVRVLRRGADHAWSSDFWPYDPIGTVDYGGEYPKTDAVYEMTLSWSENDQPSIVLTIEGETATAVRLGRQTNSMTAADWDQFGDDLQDAVRDLPSMNDDVEVFDFSATGSNNRVIRIVFGGSLSGDQYQVLAAVTGSANMAAVVTNVQVGKTEGEPIVSAERGYPATMVEAQQRAIYGGIAVRPAALLGSKLGEYFNINTEAVGADQAFLEALSVDRSEAITHLLWDKYLVVFTSENEYFANNRDLSKDQPKNMINAGSENGSRRSCRPKRIAGEIFYVSGNGEILYAANYDDVQTSYLSAEVSLLHSHFVSDVQRIEMQRGDAATDGSRLLLLRGDGKLAQAMIIRGQDVFGFSWWLTPGTIMDIAGDKDNVMWLGVERAGPDGPVTCLESFEEGELLHSAIAVGPSDLAGVVNGLEDFEGQSVWAVADGYVLGPYTVASGEITLPDPATNVRVGLWSAPYGETLGYLASNDSGEIIRRPGRIATVRLNLSETTSLAIGANGSAVRNQTLTRVGDTIDAPPPAYNGQLKVSGLRGHVQGPTVVMTQTRPGTLHVRNLMVEPSL